MNPDKHLELEEVVRFLSKNFPEHVPNPNYDKAAFFKQLPREGTLLDVGCGNNSPSITKKLLPNWWYIGLDIEDYNQTEPNCSDEYIIASPDEFCSKIGQFKNRIDAIVSSHNLEHTENRIDTLRMMAKTLKPGGRMYLSFPTQDSINFSPGHRSGCLNYYDDCTHTANPPDFSEVVATLYDENLRIIYANSRYQPPLHWITGLYNEEKSVKDLEVKDGTWALWGFESIIWAEKVNGNGISRG